MQGLLIFDPDPVSPPAPENSGWQAHLTLECELSDRRTVARRCVHQGPIYIQRALYPDKDGAAHFYLLHPPGGLVQGDRIEIDVTASSGTQTLLTTPSAAKLYRTPAGGTHQRVRLGVAAGAAVEWLPQEAILFNGASGHTGLELMLAVDSRVIAWDAWVLGRAAAGECFEHGLYDNRLSVYLNGRLHWHERTRVPGRADSPMQQASWGLGGHSVLGTLVAYGPAAIDEVLVEHVRKALGDIRAELGVTRIDGLLVVRILCSDTQTLHQALYRAWQVLRPAIMGRTAVAPRIWAT